MDNFDLGLTASALIFMRIIMMPLILYNISWSFRSFKNLLSGKNFPSSLYESMVFFMSSGLLGYHITAFVGGSVSNSAFALLFQCLFFLASLIAFIGKQLSMTLDFEKFYWLFKDNSLDVATRVASVYRLDPEYVEATLATLEDTMAIRIAQKAVSDGIPD